MAATHTLPQLSYTDNSVTTIEPRNGVITLFGYGIKVHVDRGHLIIDDGIGAERRRARLPRVGHGLRRLVIVGSDGFVSLAGLRWLSDQKAALILLERSGKVLVSTGPTGPSDARLRRAQALARGTDRALSISRELIARKLAGQERVAGDELQRPDLATIIVQCRSALDSTTTIDGVRSLEAQAAQSYWAAWRTVEVSFPKSDLTRVPDHWRRFGTRKSALSGSPRLATNPPNSMLNFLYALLESEARLAAVALGLDPGLGFIHVDTDARDSLACDLMEAVRPEVDMYVLNWIRREPLRREWFFEQRNGNCRLMGTFASLLSETLPSWRALVAPVAEWVSRTLWSTVRNQSNPMYPATPLTQLHRRLIKSPETGVPIVAAPQPPRVCKWCGKPAQPRKRQCAACGVIIQREKFSKIAERGRVAAHTPEAEGKRGETQRKRFIAQRNWNKSDQPDWLTEELYRTEIQLRLPSVMATAIAVALGVSKAYAADIRKGLRQPHARHWKVLASLVGLSSNTI